MTYKKKLLDQIEESPRDSNSEIRPQSKDLLQKRTVAKGGGIEAPPRFGGKKQWTNSSCSWVKRGLIKNRIKLIERIKQGIGGEEISESKESIIKRRKLRTKMPLPSISISISISFPISISISIALHSQTEKKTGFCKKNSKDKVWLESKICFFLFFFKIIFKKILSVYLFYKDGVGKIQYIFFFLLSASGFLLHDWCAVVCGLWTVDRRPWTVHCTLSCPVFLLCPITQNFLFFFPSKPTV